MILNQSYFSITIKFDCKLSFIFGGFKERLFINLVLDYNSKDSYYPLVNQEFKVLGILCIDCFFKKIDKHLYSISIIIIRKAFVFDKHYFNVKDQKNHYQK